MTFRGSWTRYWPMPRHRAEARPLIWLPEKNRGHAERSSVVGGGGDGTQSKHPVRAD